MAELAPFPSSSKMQGNEILERKLQRNLQEIQRADGIKLLPKEFLLQKEHKGKSGVLLEHQGTAHFDHSKSKSTSPS